MERKESDQERETKKEAVGERENSMGGGQNPTSSKHRKEIV